MCAIGGSGFTPRAAAFGSRVFPLSTCRPRWWLRSAVHLVTARSEMVKARVRKPLSHCSGSLGCVDGHVWRRHDGADVSRLAGTRHISSSITAKGLTGCYSAGVCTTTVSRVLSAALGPRARRLPWRAVPSLVCTLAVCRTRVDLSLGLIAGLLLGIVSLVLVGHAAAKLLVASSAVTAATVVSASSSSAAPKVVAAMVIEVAIIARIVSCLESCVKVAKITGAHAGTTLIVIILVETPRL